MRRSSRDRSGRSNGGAGILGGDFVGAILTFLMLGGALMFYSAIAGNSLAKEESYDKLLYFLEKGEVKELEESPPYIIATIKSGENAFRIRVKMSTKRMGEDRGIMEKALKSKERIVIRADDGKGGQSIFNFFSGLLSIVVSLYFLYYLKNMNDRISSPNFGDDKNLQILDSADTSKVSFNDIAGVDEAKGELEEIVDFLQSPSKFKKLGAKVPKGVLLLGRPGTGKTLLAKALASKAGVPFFNISGSEFEEVFVGLGASRVRNLFEKAKKEAPSIIFIDEIDSVAGRRGRGRGLGSSSSEQTLNQLLVAMDGFDSNSGVMVIAATNRPDVLDKALTRPGRFDRQVVVDAPTLIGREEILKVHAKNKKLDSSVDLKTIARKTPGFVGADLANVLNEAAILAARHKRKSIVVDDVEEAVERVMTGPELKSKVINEKEKKVIAYHESGHALVAYLLPDTDPVHKISIIPRGYGALGYTLQLPYEDKVLISKNQFISEIKILMGGRAAEELIFQEITSGASNDIKRATDIAESMVKKYGMSSEFGPVALKDDNEGQRFAYLSKSEKMSKSANAEIVKLVNECYIEAKELLKKNIKRLELLTNHLLDKEILYGNEMEEILKKA